MADEEQKETKAAPPARRTAAAAGGSRAPDRGRCDYRVARCSSARRRTRRAVPEGVAHVHATFNNTIVTITDPLGLVVAWSSAGSVGFKGSRKGTPFAAQMAAEAAARKCSDYGMRSVIVSRQGSGRRPRIGGARAAGDRARGNFDQGRDADTAQRMPSAQTAPGLMRRVFYRGIRWLEILDQFAGCAGARA